MTQTRRRFPESFKREAVDQVLPAQRFVMWPKHWYR